ncbi:MAG: MATE family efflux transporter, partial [Saprospiraceae bacterium]
IAAFVFFLLYLLFDKHISFLNLFKFPKFNIDHIRTIVNISTPILFQSIIGISSWFLFFVFIEKLGERSLAISNLLRVIYLIFTIPSWGYALSLNSIVSKTIGRKKEKRVIKLVTHGSILSILTTALISFPFLFFPSTMMASLLQGNSQDIFIDSKAYFPLLFLILLVASYSIIIFNGVSGTGETMKVLKIQIVCSVVYLVTCYIAILHPTTLGLYGAWGAELAYWAIQGLLSWFVLQSGKWQFLKF